MWYEYVSQANGYYVRLNKAEPELDELSDFEVEVLDQTDQQYGGMDRFDLVNFTHTLPEWHDPDDHTLARGFRGK